MDTVINIASNICVAAILSGVLEYILPEGRLKSGASKALGLVMLLCIARPIAEAVKGIGV